MQKLPSIYHRTVQFEHVPTLFKLITENLKANRDVEIYFFIEKQFVLKDSEYKLERK